MITIIVHTKGTFVIAAVVIFELLEVARVVEIAVRGMSIGQDVAGTAVVSSDARLTVTVLHPLLEAGQQSSFFFLSRIGIARKLRYYR